MPGVTKEQIQAAREADLFTYLQFHEPGVLKRDGPNFRHKEHDSLVYVTGKRYWYWNSRGRSINALDYLIQIRGYGLVDAVHALVGGEIRHTPTYRSTAEIQVSKELEKKAFSLPWARRCATAAVSYLQKRGISSEVIRQCLQAGIFYEARYHGEPVCVFVGKDDSGKAKFACMRSISGNLKKDVYGSDKGYNFCYPPQSPGSRHVAVFEAPIDALCQNVHAVITAQTKQIKSDYEIKLKQQEIVQKVGNANMLTKALIDRLINKVYVFPGDRIEIEYATQDFLETKESEKEV